MTTISAVSFLPTPKNLQIGLGLLNVLNLSEFKAVLAHEFGHFTQKSMRVGSYVYIANRFMIDMVAGRDWLDDLMLRLRRYRNFVGAMATLCWGIFWLFRKVLTGCFYGINFLGRALLAREGVSRRPRRRQRRRQRRHRPRPLPPGVRRAGAGTGRPRAADRLAARFVYK